MLRIEILSKEEINGTQDKKKIKKSHKVGSAILIWVNCIILSFFSFSCTHYNRLLVCSRYPRAL